MDNSASSFGNVDEALDEVADLLRAEEADLASKPPPSAGILTDFLETREALDHSRRQIDIYRQEVDNLERRLNSSNAKSFEALKRQLMLFDPAALLSNKVDPEVDPLSSAFDDELFNLQRKLSARLVQVADELERRSKLRASVDRVDDSSLRCVICFDGLRSHVLVPCGHHCLCARCSVDYHEGNDEVQWADEGLSCPICRAKVTNAIRIFLQ